MVGDRSKRTSVDDMTPLFRALSQLSGAAVASQVLAIISAPLLLRLYPPEAYGTYLAMTVITNLGSTIATLRFELAIQAAQSGRRATLLAAAALFSTLWVSAAITVAVMASHDVIERSLKVDVVDVIYFVPLVLISTGATETFRFLLWRQKRYGATAVATVLTAAMTILLQVILGLNNGTSHGILLGAGLGQLAGTIFLAAYARGSNCHRMRNAVAFRAAMSTAVAYRDYPTITAPAGFVHMIGSMAPAAVVTAVYGPSVAGLYYLGSRLIAAPMNVLSSAVYPTFIGRATELYRSDRRELRRVFLWFVAGTVLAMSPLLLLFAIGEDLFAFVFGESWRASGQFAAWIAVGSTFHLAATSTSLLTVLRKNQVHACWVALNLLFVGAAAFTIGYQEPSPSVGVAIFAASSVLSYATLLLLNMLTIIWGRDG